jgi:hypothetical protein
MLYRLFALTAFSCLACAGPKTIKQPQAETWDLEFQAKPLTTKTVRTKIAGQSAILGACFQRERLSSDVLASFVFELIIPNDGTPHQVIRVSTSQPQQEILSECVHLQLKKLKFTPHAGPSLRLKVPIQAEAPGS